LIKDVSANRKSWRSRVGWLVLIWVLSVVALGLVAFFFRGIMAMAGLTA
jgi:hypothetical protein